MIAVGVLLVGLLFKIQHWPGAQICILASSVCLITIPILTALQKYRKNFLDIIVSNWILLFGTGTIFKMFHWPVGGLVTIVSLMILPVVTISLGIHLWKNKKSQA